MKISLETLTELHSLSVRSYNVCLENELHDLKAIINFYTEHKTFLQLDKAGRKTENELVSICEYYLKDDFCSQSFRSICSSENISTKSQIFIEKNKIISLEEFVIFSSSLEAIPNDLKKIYLKFHFLSEKPLLKKSERKILKVLEQISSSEIIDIIEFLRSQQADQLSTRSCNILDKIVSEIINDPMLILKYENSNEILKIELAGRKTLKELLPFIKKVIIALEDGSHKREENNEIRLFQIESSLGYKKDTLKEWLNKKELVIEELPILPLVKFHLSQKISKRGLDIVKASFPVGNKNKKKSLQTLGDSYSISRERIRQLRNSTISKIENEIKILKVVLNKYDILTLDLFIEKKSFLSLRQIENIKRIKFPETILYKILSILYDEYDLVINDKKKHFYKYLALGRIVKSVNFQKLTGKIKLIVKTKIKKTIRLNIKELLREFKVDNNLKVNNDDVEGIAIRLVYEEYGLETINGEIIIPRNTIKLTYEYIEEILERNATPMNVSEILPQLNVLFKEKPKNIESVRSQLLNHPDVFILTEWSTYGLKEWEDEGTELGGTHRQIVEKYLKKFDEPKHIYEIFRFVSKYRSTSALSLFSNIKIDPRKTFVILEGGFIGLSSISYSTSKTIFNKVNNQWFRTFSNDFVVNGRSEMILTDLYKSLALKLNVLPIQIESLINDRIEKGELLVDSKGFLFLNERFEDIEMVGGNPFFLDEASLVEVKKKLISEDHLEALQLCMEFAKNKGYDLSISKAKFILDELYTQLKNKK